MGIPEKHQKKREGDDRVGYRKTGHPSGRKKLCPIALLRKLIGGSSNKRMVMGEFVQGGNQSRNGCCRHVTQKKIRP